MCISASPTDVGDLLSNVTVGQVTSFIMSVITVILVFKKVIPFFTGIKLFLDDWNGTEDRPGVSGKPGVLMRILALETSNTRIESELGKLTRKESDG